MNMQKKFPTEPEYSLDAEEHYRGKNMSAPTRAGWDVEGVLGEYQCDCGQGVFVLALGTHYRLLAHCVSCGREMCVRWE